jgi:hypothetical protein
MSLIHCTDCGHDLGNAPRNTPCPKCGSTNRTVGAVGLAAGKASVSGRGGWSTTKEEIKKNWPLIAVLALCDLLSTVPAYFLSGFLSVAVTVFFILFSTIVGYYAITRVITITTENH